MSKFKTAWKQANGVKKFGIDNAGPVPNTILARQDLEDENKKDLLGVNVQMHKADAASDDKLEVIKDETEDVTGKEEKNELVDRIKTVQEKRQKATIKQRDMTKSSFKQLWKSVYDRNRNVGYSGSTEKQYKDADDAERAWINLKQNKKAVLDELASLSDSATGLQKELEAKNTMTTSKKASLAKIQAEIERVLNFLKDNG